MSPEENQEKKERLLEKSKSNSVLKHIQSIEIEREETKEELIIAEAANSKLEETGFNPPEDDDDDCDIDDAIDDSMEMPPEAGIQMVYTRARVSRTKPEFSRDKAVTSPFPRGDFRKDANESNANVAENSFFGGRKSK